MKNKLSQWFIDYVKKKNGVDLSKNDPQDNWTAMNPFKYSIRLGRHVMKFIDQKHNKEKGDKWVVNDVSGGTYDDKMFQTISEIKVPYILMHLRGTPNNMMTKTNYNNLILNLIEYFDEKITKLKSYGVNDIIIDPGFGFAKDFHQNYDLLYNLNLFKILDLPILVGLSRKSFVKKKYGVDNALEGTLDLNKIAIENGANIIRVHDVLEHYNLIKSFINNSWYLLDKT